MGAELVSRVFGTRIFAVEAAVKVCSIVHKYIHNGVTVGQPPITGRGRSSSQSELRPFTPQILEIQSWGKGGKGGGDVQS